jgi:hypothetical protein
MSSAVSVYAALVFPAASVAMTRYVTVIGWFLFPEVCATVSV